MFGQLNRCLSLREIAIGIDLSPEFLSDIGLSQSPAKSTMSSGNEKRNYRVFETLYYSLLRFYRSSLSHRPEQKVIEEVKNFSIKIVDSTIMTVALGLFSWAKYRTAKGGIKAHVSLDEATMVPDIVNISEAKMSDRRGVDNFRYPQDTIVVDDRGYFDCKLFKIRIEDSNWFVTRLKDNVLYETVEELDLICYLLLELIRRTLSKTPHRFGHFVTLIRVCLTQYNRLGYVVNATQIRVRKARTRAKSPPNLFTTGNNKKDFEQLLMNF